MIMSIGMGAALPGFCLVFGEMIDGVADTGSSSGEDEMFDNLKFQSMVMAIMGGALFFIGFLQVSTTVHFAENVGHRTQINYFRQCLEKDAYFYDQQNPTEMASKIAKEMTAMKKGLGSKVGNIGMGVFSFIFGIGFSFYWGWLMTLILMGFMPVMIVSGSLLGVAL